MWDRIQNELPPQPLQVIIEETLVGFNCFPWCRPSQDNGGWTPIIWAAEHKHLEVIRALLNRGADVTIKDKVSNHYFLSGSLVLEQVEILHFEDGYPLSILFLPDKSQVLSLTQ